MLVPRTETKLTGSPVGKTEFGAQLDAKKARSLFAPGGITVNPTNHQVLITGWIGGEVPEVWAVSESRAKSKPSGKTKPASSKNAGA